MKIARFNEEPVSEIDFEQELYKAFGHVKDFTLCMRIASRFYEMGKQHQVQPDKDFRARYKRIAESDAFKRTHDGASIGDVIKVDGEDIGDYDKKAVIDAAMAEIEEKSKAFTKVHQGESSNEILAQMRGEEHVSIINNDIYEAFKAGSQWQRQQMSKDIFCQEIYNDGYKKGQDDMDARFRIGTVYANNEHVRHFEAVKKLVEENPNLSDEYKRGKLEAIDLYMGMELFSHDVDKAVLRKTAEEQARIVRNRLEQRYSEAVKQQRIDMNTYTQITVCIEAVYQELFFAGFNVGLGELIGPQKITLNKEG